MTTAVTLLYWNCTRSTACYRMKTPLRRVTSGVVDESGEDYLYSADRFVEIEPPQTVRRSLLHAGKAA